LTPRGEARRLRVNPGFSFTEIIERQKIGLYDALDKQEKK
jgi:hypothetical protein